MNWLALLGVLSGGYGIFAVFVALKKPEKIWNMGKVKGFIEKFGERGTQVWFCVFGAVLIGLGVWLILR